MKPRGQRKPCPNDCGRMIAEQQMGQHLEACSGGRMTVDTQEENIVRLLTDGKTQREAAVLIGIKVQALRQGLVRLRRKWDAKTTHQLLVMIATEKQDLLRSGVEER